MFIYFRLILSAMANSAPYSLKLKNGKQIARKCVYIKLIRYDSIILKVGQN